MSEVNTKLGYEECWIPEELDAYAGMGPGPAQLAHGVVRGQRQADYGHPLDNHQRIADFWTVRLKDKLKPGETIEPHEAAALMRLVKEARLMNTPGHKDTLVDICGYADVEDLIHEESARRAQGS